MAGSKRSPGTAARTSATQDPSLLGGHCRVLDLADLSGAVCGRIMADLGADVVKVEPPGGEPDRMQPPFVGDVENSARSIPWLAANVNKRGITCDLTSAEGRAPVRTSQPQSPYWSGMYGALGALVAMQAPLAQRVDVSAQAAMTSSRERMPLESFTVSTSC